MPHEPPPPRLFTVAEGSRNTIGSHRQSRAHRVTQSLIIIIKSTTSKESIQASRNWCLNSGPEVLCQVFLAVSTIEVSSGEPRRLSALRYVDSS
jgi:hypothetical protein